MERCGRAQLLRSPHGELREDCFWLRKKEGIIESAAVALAVRSSEVVDEHVVERMVFLDAKVLTGGDTGMRRNSKTELIVSGLITAWLVGGSRSVTMLRCGLVKEDD